MGSGPIPVEELDQYSATARRTALGLHLALSSNWDGRELLKHVLKREFPRIISYLLFKGREVPRDANIVDAVEQCPPGGLIVVHGSHCAPILNLTKPLRLEGVGIGRHKVVLRTRLVAKPGKVQGPPVLSRGVTAQFNDVRATIASSQELPPRMTVQLHNIHFLQVGRKQTTQSSPQRGYGPGMDSTFKVRDPFDVDKAIPEPHCSLLHVCSRVRVQAVQCLFEEPPDSNLGCGIFVDEGGRLEAVDSVLKNAQEYGLVTFGVSKLARCRIMGSQVGARMVAGAHQDPQLILKGCILQDNREIGVYLPTAGSFGNQDDESSLPPRCMLQGSTISRSWYPVAQKTWQDTPWERHPWVEPPQDYVGLLVDTRSQLQQLTEADYDRNMDIEDDRPPSRCPSSIALSDTEKFWDVEEDWDYQHGCIGPEPPRPTASSQQPSRLPKGARRHHGPKW
eukprot:TRINITY_DN78242_c0_g1_i1.p1 TRINITY_DN78242_c0_g1~~TRINITY_DN78242_c0_g1_i1.p1  ORF type:complete len:451 (+),score=52.35 TRINITY_DN78242_c0_g1_i1:135-1487(+)